MKFLRKFWFPLSIIVLLAAVLILFFMIKKQPPVREKIKIDPQFAEYVSAVTSGVISSGSTIKVILVNAFAGDSAQQENVKDKLFRFNPGVDGTVRWIDDRTVEFTPDEHFIQGQYYEASFNLEKVAKVPDILRVMKFSFQVIKQNFSVEVEGLRCYPDKVQYYYLTGIVKTADDASISGVEKLLKVNFPQSLKELRWEHSADAREHRFFIDSISRPEQEQNLEVIWDGKSLGIENTGSQSVKVPEKDVFIVLSAKLVQQPESMIQILFSDPVDAAQYLSGLITLSNRVQLRFVVENNLIKAYPTQTNLGESIRLSISGITNISGKKLTRNYDTDIYFSQIKPMVELLGKGVILPNSEGLIFPFRAVNLKAVDVEVIKIFENNIPQFLQINSLDGQYQLKRVGRPLIKQKIELVSDKMLDYGKWNNFSIDLSKIIKTDPGSLYRITLSFRKAYSLYPCNDTSQNAQSRIEEEDENYDEQLAEESYWNSSEDYYDEYEEYYDGDWSEYYHNQENPCHKAYYRNKSVSQNMIASDFGLTAKLNRTNEINVVVSSILEAKPLSNVTVDVLDFQNQVMATMETNSDGRVTVQLEHKPYLIIARKGAERGYLNLREEASLNLSRFDIGGDMVQKGLKGFIYGERGVWRPGDTLFIGFILEDKNNTFPSSHPIVFELADPQGRPVTRQIRSNPLNGFYTFIFATESTAPTGKYHLTIKAGGATFFKTLKIESIKPNRLSVKLDFGSQVIIAGQNYNGTVEVKWLHGAVAQNLKTKIAVTLTKTATLFQKYSQYIFDDPARDFETEEQVLFDGRVDENGKALVPIKITPSNEAPGFLKAAFSTRVFEEGGDYSIDYYSVTLSPFEYYVGILPPQGDVSRGMLLTDTTHTVQVVTLDAEGRPVSRTGLKAMVYKMKWKWWWEKSNEDLATYIGNNYATPIITKNFDTRNGSGSFTFRVNYPEWGRFYIRVIDQAGHSTGKIAYIDWPGWAGKARKEDPEGASVLSLVADKDKYQVGETAIVTIPSSGLGRALVSVESGSKVINMFWADISQVKENRSRIEVPVTPEMSPNAYLNITVLQPHGKTGNDMPIRMYGYINVLVEDPATRLIPEIQVPDQIQSEEKVELKVSEKNGKAMTYTVAIVDEGLLGLTRFKTQDPWSTFYAREALGIRTWDLYDLIFGGYGGKIEQLFAIGGDEEIRGKGDKNANRFKPVVKFMGPFELGEGNTNTHTFILPKYMGAVRTMVVAGQKGAYGVAEKTTLVKNSLMVMATLPRVLGTNEMVYLPVTVFADNNVKKVKIEVSFNDLFTFDGEAKQQLEFDQSGNKDVVFSLKTVSFEGVGRIKVRASSGSYKADYEIEILVRNPNPLVSLVLVKPVEKGEQWQDEMILPGMSGTNKATLEVSTIPPVNLKKHIDYLIHYPYGCAEQTTSSVFPQLFLSGLVELNEAQKSEIDKNIKNALIRLNGFQASSGGFNYWPSSTFTDDWISSYVGHFFIQAEKRGYKLPDGSLERWIRYQKNQAVQYSVTTADTWHPYMQAYRLYTLSLAGQPELGAMNRLKETGNLPLMARVNLALAYVLASEEETARQLIANNSMVISKYSDDYYTYGSDVRDKAMILELYSRLKEYDKAIEVFNQLSEILSGNYWNGTQSIAFSLMSMHNFAVESGKFSGSLDCILEVNGQKRQLQSSFKVGQLEIDVNALEKIPFTFTNHGDGLLYARMIMHGIPAAGNETEETSNLEIKVTYKDLKGNVISVEKMQQGSDFKVEVNVRNTDNIKKIHNLALTQVFPSGWEIMNSRINDVVSAHTEDVPDYQDIRDDRVLTYFGLTPGQSKTFVIVLNASYAGRFYLPAVTCEAMYDGQIYARKKGMWVEIDN